MSSWKAEGFVHTPLLDPEKIEHIKSVCTYCGWESNGTVSDGLPERELEHAGDCEKRKSAA
jgi:hypothetical protein